MASWKPAYSAKHPFVTVSEAADLCGVTQPTIRKKIKEYSMKTWLDQKKRIHIRTLDLLPYHDSVITTRVMKLEEKIRKLIKERAKALDAYYALEKEYDEQVEDGSIYISQTDLDRQLYFVYQACHALTDAMSELHDLVYTGSLIL